MGKGFWSLIAVLAAIYVANVVGPPPPNVTAIAVSVLVLTPVLWFWGNRADVRGAMRQAFTEPMGDGRKRLRTTWRDHHPVGAE